MLPLLEGLSSGTLTASWVPLRRASLGPGAGCTEPKLTRSAGTQTALMDRIQSLSGGVGVWIAHMTWHGAMTKILACIHVVSQLISLPKIWSTTGCDVNTWHLLGESQDPAWCWPCWSQSSCSVLCSSRAEYCPEEQNIICEKSSSSLSSYSASKWACIYSVLIHKLIQKAKTPFLFFW